jgi:hypothetical protein
MHLRIEPEIEIRRSGYILRSFFGASCEHAPSRPYLCCSPWSIAIVVITSYFRLRLGRSLWKAFHFVIYAAAIALFWHSIFTDPNLKNTPLDPFDGEKVFIEACCTFILLFAFLRWRHAVHKGQLRRKIMRMAETGLRPTIRGENST